MVDQINGKPHQKRKVQGKRLKLLQSGCQSFVYDVDCHDVQYDEV